MLVNINWKSNKVRIIIAGAILTLAVIGYLIWRNKKLRTKEKQLLEAKDVLIKKQEMLKEIANQLDTLKSEVQSNFEPSDEEPIIKLQTKGNDEFPLNYRKNSQGRNVVAVQLWLQQYQGEDLPKYGANGHYNSETDEAVRRVTTRDSISKKFFVNRRELLAIQNKLMNND